MKQKKDSMEKKVNQLKTKKVRMRLTNVKRQPKDIGNKIKTEER